VLERRRREKEEALNQTWTPQAGVKNKMIFAQSEIGSRRVLDKPASS